MLETPYGNEAEKRVVQRTVREACQIDPSVSMVTAINEVWVTVDPDRETLHRHREVRHIPGREDALMVVTNHRDQRWRMTRWVVKLKAHPANNRLLERDDERGDDIADLYGPNFGFFAPERPVPREAG